MLEDLFSHRNQGGRFDIGIDEDDAVSALIGVGDKMITVTRKNITAVVMADTIDPGRTNPSIPHTMQQIVSFGSSDELVGRTFLQSESLFKDHSLTDSIDTSEGLKIGLAFLIEMVSLRSLGYKYLEEERVINAEYTGKVLGNALRMPAMENIDQSVKQFVINADHAARHLMELSQLFFPEILNRDWQNSLLDSIKSRVSPNELKFIEELCKRISSLRKLRNAIEHPSNGDKVEIENYQLSAAGNISSPTIKYVHKKFPLQKVQVSTFMSEIVSDLVAYFEGLLVILSAQFLKPFAGDERAVVEIPLQDRRPGREHVRFDYQILWTK